MTISFCGGTARIQRRRFDLCPACKTADSWIVTAHASSGYWPPIHACTNCGDRWSDGERLERPFRRGWRQQSVNAAQQDWEAGCECPTEWTEDYCLRPCAHQQAT